MDIGEDGERPSATPGKEQANGERADLPLCKDMCRVGVDAPSNIALSKKSIVDSV